MIPAASKLRLTKSTASRCRLPNVTWLRPKATPMRFTVSRQYQPKTTFLESWYTNAPMATRPIIPRSNVTIGDLFYVPSETRNKDNWPYSYSSVRQAPINCLVLRNDQILAVHRRNMLESALCYALTIRRVGYKRVHGSSDQLAIAHVCQNA